jgi:CheY-like chemotaxis protein
LENENTVSCSRYLSLRPKLAKNMARPSFFLLADDDEDDQQFFLEALQSIDPEIQCITARNGKEALTLLQNDFFALPDFVFLDLNMPLMNGMKCLEEIKKIPALAELPVVLYSTTSEKAFEEQSKKAGAYAFFVKPTRASELADYLRRLVFT